MQHCRDCQFSEGVASAREGGGLVLRLFCSVTGMRAIEPCAAFAQADSGEARQECVRDDT